MTTQLIDHTEGMRRAIALTARVPELPFGAVIVDPSAGTILAEGWNQSSVNPTLHGEIAVINAWSATAWTGDPADLILYTTAEPCPMCQAAILWAGIGTVVYGTSIAFLQQHGWHQIDIRAAEVIARTPFRSCTLIGGVLEAECNQLFETAMRRKDEAS
jgi:tRNA(Arg) A34 adenosine deaminase TadA